MMYVEFMKNFFWPIRAIWWLLHSFWHPEPKKKWFLNHSINSGVFPDEWKCSKVIPLFKQGERHDPNNYRPISIIPVVAKVFERIIYDQVKAFIDENKLFFKSQSGFRSLHSTVTALLEATNDWAYNIDCGNVNAVVFLDLKKAFDTVDHEILVSKLNAYGIRHGANDWFKSYLSDRTQKSLVNGFLSEDRFISCGVPQGTILGPLLFLLYINDLPNCLKHSHPRMFADDTHLTYSAATVHDIDQNLTFAFLTFSGSCNSWASVVFVERVRRIMEKGSSCRGWKVVEVLNRE